MSECLFCRIVAGEIPSYKVYEDDHTYVFLDIFPATKGHLLVIPKEHHADIFDISSQLFASVSATAKKMSDLLMEKLNPNGVTILQANREAGWQTVFHLHMHVIPRWADDGLRQPWKPMTTDNDALKSLFTSLIA